MAKNFDLSVILRVLDKASDPLKKIGRAFTGLSGPVSEADKKIKKLGESISKSGEKMKKVGRDMSLKFTLPITAGMGLSLKSVMEFNKGMANVATLIPGQTRRLHELGEAVKGMAIRTGNATDVMTQGLYQVISYLGDTADTEKILEINAKAAAAGLASVADSVNLTSAVMKGYNDISAKMAQRVADLAFQTVKLGATTFPELAESMRGSIAWAGQLNVPLKDLFGTFSTLTGVTGSTAEVGTQMEAVLRGLVKATPTMTAVIKNFGYSSAKTMIQAIGLSGALKKIYEITKGSEEAMTLLFGRAEPLAAVFALTGKLAGTYAEKLEAMKNASGAMSEAFKEQAEGINKVGFRWQVFKIRIGLATDALGEAVLPVFNRFLSILEPIVDWFTRLSEKTRTIIAVLLGLVAVAGPLLILFGMISSGIGGLVLLSGTLGISFGALALTIGQIAIAIAAVSASFAVLIAHWEEWSEFIVKLTNLVAGFGEELIKTFVTGPIDAVFDKMMKVGSWIGKGVSYVGFGPASMEGQKSQTEVHIKLSADQGTSATVQGVKTKKGDANVSVVSPAYQGVF